MKKIRIAAMMMVLMPVTAGAEVYNLPAVVVNADWQKEQETVTPQDRQVVTRKDIAQMGASNVVEALGLALGVDTSSGNQDSQSVMGSNQLMIRGMNTNQTLVLVDGHRLADEDTASTQNMTLLSRLNLSQVEEIDITRGASSAIYGSGAMGGVIEIKTRKPGSGDNLAGFQVGTRENTSYFRLDPKVERRFHLAVDGRITKARPLTFRRNTFITYGPSTIHYDGWDVPTWGIRRYLGLDGLYDFQNRSNNSLRFQLNYFEEEPHMRFSDSLAEFMGRSLVVQQGERSRTDRTLWDTALTYEGKTGRNEYSGQIYYNRMKKYIETWNDRPDIRRQMEDWPVFQMPGMDHVKTIMLGVGNLLSEEYPSWDYDKAFYESWGTEWKDRMTWGNHSFLFGGEWKKNTYTGTRLSDTQGEDKREEGHEQHSGALYVSDTWRMGSRFTFIPSMRMEKGNRYGFVGIPAAGIVYQADDHLKFKADYGKGFRAPSISEMYIHLDHMGIRIDGNPDLHSETSHNFDVGMEWENGRTGWKVSWFDQKVHNLIDYQELFSGSRQYIYVNRNRAELKGVEGQVSYHLSPRWTAEASYTYLDGRDKSEGTRLSNRSRHTALVSLSYDGKDPYGFTGKLWSVFKKDFAFDDKNYIWNEVNLSLQKHWGKAYTLTLGLYNLADREIDELYIHGRSWFTGLEMHW